MSLRMMFLPKMDAPAKRPSKSQPMGARDDRTADVHDDPTNNLRAIGAVRLFAIFWLVTVVFFELSAFKRRAYLLPLWPASAVLLSCR